MKWFGLLFLVACVQKPPHANVIVHAERQPTSHAVLVLPTKCETALYSALCSPSTYAREGSNRQYASSFAEYIDPALRLKLEFAGFTLGEAGAMRVRTADRIETNDHVQIEGGPGPQTVAELGFEDVRTVASSLSLTSLLIPSLTIGGAKYGMKRAELVVVLVDVKTARPRWTVTCSELLYDAIETPNRLANCAGNGVLAVLAPHNIIGKAL